MRSLLDSNVVVYAFDCADLLKQQKALEILRCSRVLSEDLQHGRDFDGVQVVDPFLDGA